MLEYTIDPIDTLRVSESVLGYWGKTWNVVQTTYSWSRLEDLCGKGRPKSVLIICCLRS